MKSLAGFIFLRRVGVVPKRGSPVRKKSSRKSRSNTQLDVRKLYVNGFCCDVFAPIEVPSPSETEFEILFCESILRSDAGHYEAMVALGDAYTRIGEFQKGL